MSRAASALVAAAVTVVALVAVRLLGLGGDGPQAMLLLVPVVIAYALGASAGPWAGLTAVLALAAALQATSPTFNPFFEMITIGPWLVGRTVRSRHDLADRLAARNTELRAEQERYRRESLRHERARIARELHDIVAHSVSLIVVQAAAGQRAPEGDRTAMVAALDCVAQAAEQAAHEVSTLIAWLSGAPSDDGPPGLDRVGELAHITSRTGVAVTCRITAGSETLTPAASEAGYRVVQEALTNAVKHAPGAPVEVRVLEIDGAVEVTVVNGRPDGRESGLASTGSGRGLAGLRDRVAACRGQLSAGPVGAGGWQVSAILPAAGAMNPPQARTLIPPPVPWLAARPSRRG